MITVGMGHQNKIKFLHPIPSNDERHGLLENMLKTFQFSLSMDSENHFHLGEHNLLLYPPWQNVHIFQENNRITATFLNIDKVDFIS